MPKPTLGGGSTAIGAYRDLITIRAPLTAGSAQTRDVAVDLWAQVTPLRAWERLQAAQLQSAVEYHVAIPACPPVDATMHLVWSTAPQGQAVRLNIQGVVLGITETVCDCVEAHA